MVVVKKFAYLIDKISECKKEVENCVVQRRIVVRAINALLREKGLRMDAVRGQ